MNPNLKEFTERRLQEAKEGRNPVIIFSEINGYLEGMRDSGTITPIEYVDLYYDFSIRLVKTICPNIESDQEALDKLKNWKLAMNTISLHM